MAILVSNHAIGFGTRLAHFQYPQALPQLFLKNI